MKTWKWIVLWQFISAIIFACIISYMYESKQSLKELKELEIRLLQLQIKKLELELQDTLEIYIKVKE